VLPVYLISLVTSVVFFAILIGLGNSSLGDNTGSGVSAGLVGISIVGGLIILLVNVIAVLASQWIIVHDAAARPTTRAESFRFARRRLGPAIGLAFVAYLVLIVAVIALILPGIWVGVIMLTMLPGVVIFERGQSIRRSFALARGGWWGLFGRVLVLFLVAIGYGIAVQIVAVIVGLASPILSAIVSAVLQVPLQLVMLAVPIVTYAERRATKEHCTTATLLADLTR